MTFAPPKYASSAPGPVTGQARAIHRCVSRPPVGSVEARRHCRKKRALLGRRSWRHPEVKEPAADSSIRDWDAPERTWRGIGLGRWVGTPPCRAPLACYKAPAVAECGCCRPSLFLMDPI